MEKTMKSEQEWKKGKEQKEKYVRGLRQGNKENKEKGCNEDRNES